MEDIRHQLAHIAHDIEGNRSEVGDRVYRRLSRRLGRHWRRRRARALPKRRRPSMRRGQHRQHQRRIPLPPQRLRSRCRPRPPPHRPPTRRPNPPLPRRHPTMPWPITPALMVTGHNFSYRCLFLDESLNCVATHCFRQNDTADSVDPMHSPPAMLVFLMPASALLLLSLRSRHPYHFSV